MRVVNTLNSAPPSIDELLTARPTQITLICMSPRCADVASTAAHIEASLRQERPRNFLAGLPGCRDRGAGLGVVGWWRVREWLGRRAGAWGCEPGHAGDESFPVALPGSFVSATPPQPGGRRPGAGRSW